MGDVGTTCTVLWSNNHGCKPSFIKKKTTWLFVGFCFLFVCLFLLKMPRYSDYDENQTIKRVGKKGFFSPFLISC